jgi:PAS domain S-box-containing protein
MRREGDRAEQLTVDREQLDAAQSMAHLGSWEWDLRSGKISWSDELYRIFGLRPGEVEPTWTGVQERFHPEDRDEVVSKVEEAIENCDAVRHEVRLIRPDGAVRTIEFWANVVPGPRAEPEIMRGAALDVSERQRLEHELRIQSRLLAQADVAMAAADATRRISHWSSGAEKLFGLPAGEALGKRVEELDLVRGAIDLDTLDRELARRGQWGGEFIARRAEGDSVPAYGTISVLRDAGGVIESYVGVAIDRSSQKEAGEQLALQRALTQGLIDGIRAHVYVKDPQHRFLLVNKEVEAAFEVEPGSLIGQTDRALVSAGESKLIQANDRLVLDRHESIEVEERTEQDGVERIFHSHKFPLFDSDGQCFALAGVSTDITDQIRSETLVRRHAEQQALVAELGTLATEGVGFADLAQRAVDEVARLLDADFAKVLELNKEGTSFVLRAGHGFDPGLIGSAVVPATSDTQAGFTLEADEGLVVENLKEEARFKGAALLHRHEVCSGLSAPIRTQSGSAGRFGVISAHTREERVFDEQDVTFLTAVATVLGTALAKQRADALQRQLEQAQRLEAVGKLAGGIAHDFNNLLAVITNYAAFLEEELRETGGKGLEDVIEIRRAGERAADLTRQLLVFSRREVVKPEVVDVVAVVAEAESLLRRTLGEDVELEMASSKDSPRVRLGSGQLEQVLMNLCVNARDAMPEGGLLSVEVQQTQFEWPTAVTTGELSPGRYLQLTVADTGTGMTVEVASQVFEPFFTTKPKGEGTGLGLATVHGIVHENGGRIQVYSEPGKGSVFKVYLPTAAAEPTPDAAAVTPRSAAEGGTILVVEDEPAVLRLTSRILSEAGYTVVEAASPEQALELCADAPIDLILSDVVMPRMSGKELGDRCRETQPGVRLLFMSGYTGEIISRHGMLDEEVTVVEKPFSAEGLLAAVHEALAANTEGRTPGDGV